MRDKIKPASFSSKKILILVFSLLFLSFTSPVQAKTWLSGFVLGTNTQDNAIFVSNLYAPQFSESGPVKITTEITNRSSADVNPQGYLVVYDWFGKTISQSKLDPGIIYSGTIRTYENYVGGEFLFGHYKISLGSSYNDQGGLLQGSTDFWVIPWKFIGGGILLLAIVLLLIFNWKKRTIDYQKDLQRKLEHDEKEIKKLKAELRKRY